jgi:hypothetical protein
MYNHEVVKGSVDVRVTFHVMSSTDGTDETGYAFDTGGVDFWYQREFGSRVAITEATQTAGGAHADGGLVHVSDGVGSLDLPDAACAVGTDGSSYVRYGGVFTDMLVTGGVVRLVNETALSGLFSGTHSTTSGDLGTNAPANSIIGMTLYFPTVRQARIVETYNTGTGVAGWTTALAAAPQDDEAWELFPTPPLDAVTIAAIQSGLAVPGSEMDLVDVPNGTAVAAIGDELTAELAAFFGVITGAVATDGGNSETTFLTDYDAGATTLKGFLRLTSGTLAGEGCLVSLVGTPAAQVTVLSETSMPTALKQFSATPADAVTWAFTPF